MPLATIANPFRRSVVSDPWELPETDIVSVHESAFARCCEAVAAIRAHRHTTAVLVHGEAFARERGGLCRLDLEQVVQLDRLEGAPDVMKAVRPAAEHLEVEVELGARGERERQLTSRSA